MFEVVDSPLLIAALISSDISSESISCPNVSNVPSLNELATTPYSNLFSEL